MCPVGEWQKSSYSGGDDGNNCVELAMTSDGIALREGDTPEGMVVVTREVMSAFLWIVKSSAGSRS
ncbi:DUF397 domain-containing protein [Streptomyces boncukensis]|uniref:DUF397 domain-containing protein n=1 Tax=Streptomyces boncukensis TaxID=2711219 RepID=A0A6G4X546_9ACTN|nr:DUF397 domain-containing protein [Streptomyces boncukensis]NGO72645.1 DUF397 domain-containing protein [Streptomyces boncukensis]